MISVEKPGSPEEILEHFGTKGMKWGTRKRYVERLKGTAARERRVATGTGSFKDKFVSKKYYAD